MDTSIKIILAEDYPEYRKGIRDLLEESHITVLAEAGNGKELFECLETYMPDIILLDLRMPDMDGNATMAILCEKYPKIKVIILSSFGDQMLIDDYRERGACGYIIKGQVHDEQLVKIVRKVYSGSIHFMRNNDKPPVKLSERQKDIVYFQTNVTTNKEEIGEKIGMTGNGVGKQEKRIMQKFGVSNIPAYFEYIFEAGLKFLRRPPQK